MAEDIAFFDDIIKSIQISDPKNLTVIFGDNKIGPPPSILPWYSKTPKETRFSSYFLKASLCTWWTGKGHAWTRIESDRQQVKCINTCCIYYKTHWKSPFCAG